MNDWVPVSQILGNIPIPAPAQVLAATPHDLVPLPPNIPWVVVLIIMIISRFVGLVFILFTWVWSLVLANWARKLVNKNTAMVLVAMYPAGILAGGVAIAVGTASDTTALIVLGFIFLIAGLISYVLGIFKIRDAMEDYYTSKENIGLTLSGVMTFFFSIIYLQYHINRIAKWKKTGILT